MTEEKRNQLFRKHVMEFFPSVETLYEVCKSASRNNEADLSGASKMVDSYLFEYEQGRVNSMLYNLGYDVKSNSPVVLWNLYRFKISHTIVDILAEYTREKAG